MSLDPSAVTPSSVDESIALGAAAGALASAHHGPQHTHCENCGTKLEGPFCHRCGQHDFEFHRSFRHVLLEALETWFHFEGKFFRNIVTLLFRPGRLTAEFNAGKRAAQMPPFRLYLFVSVIFFTVLFLTKAADSSAVVMEKSSSSKESVEPAGAVVTGADQQPQHAAARKPVRKSQLDLSDDGEDGPFLRWVEEVGNKAIRAENRARLADSFLHSIPRLLLVCLPLFALYTRLLYLRAGQVYLQHLVMALHFHTFIFLWLLFRDGWVGLARLASPTLGSLVWVACMAWLLLYPLLMLRQLFPRSWWRTTLRASALVMAYLATFGFVFLAAVIVMIAML